MKHPLIIGAGGVTSYLLAVLIKSFLPEKITIIDKDILERRNLDRQLFSYKHIGLSKASALVDLHAHMGPEFRVINEWFTESTEIEDSVDAIICCADNHEARYQAILAAERLKVLCYIGGNEYLDSQAFVYWYEWKGTARDILLRYPNIATDETGSPVRCTGDAQISSPQLAVANLNCAAKLLHLMWVYERWLRDNQTSPTQRQQIMANLPTELFTSLIENTATICH